MTATRQIIPVSGKRQYPPARFYCRIARMDRRFRCVLFAVALAFGALCVTPAEAALGGSQAGVQADAVALQGVVTTTPLQQYDIDEITTGNGVRVREFLNTAGVVFAVSWSGPVVPDLQLLLGGHFAAYAQALAAVKQRGLQRSLRIALPDLIVEVGGYLRAYSGRAYLPASIPAGTSTADLR